MEEGIHAYCIIPIAMFMCLRIRVFVLGYLCNIVSMDLLSGKLILIFLS